MLDIRLSSLLEILMQTSQVTNKELQVSLRLSRRQVDYAINKLNDWLEINQFEHVQKQSGKIYLLDKTKSKLSNNVNEIQNEYILSEDDRTRLQFLYISASKDYVSLEHLTQFLNVSKNTILRDMKVLNSRIEQSGISIDYTRQEGYFISGDEWQIRNKMISYINKVLQHYELIQLLMESLHVDTKSIDKIIDKLSIVESVLEKTFADQSFNRFPYHFSALMHRFNNDNKITNPFFIEVKEISDTKEYEASEILLSDVSVTEIDRLYVTLQILGTPVHSRTAGSISLPLLKEVIEECVVNFERLAVVNLSNKEELIEKLYTHIKPAYYRIKYRLKTDYSYLNTINKDFSKLLVIVKESFLPLEKLFEMSLPEKEMVLIALFFGGTLIDKREIQTISQKNAVVVCPNGITMSNLLEKTLMNLLPEICFQGTMSIRDFEQTKMQFDFIFSQVQLNTDKNVIYIGDLNSHDERISLRRKVISQVYNLSLLDVNFSSLIQLINQHATVHDAKKLEDALTKFLANYNEETSLMSSEVCGLNKTLSSERIQIIEQVDNLHHAIDIAALPLLKEHIITEGYVQKMKNLYPNITDHILLRESILIPHADIASGSNDLGFSLIKLNQPLTYNGNNIHLICVIAAKDKNTHLDSILELIRIAENKALLNEIIVTRDKQTLFNLIMNLGG